MVFSLVCIYLIFCLITLPIFSFNFYFAFNNNRTVTSRHGCHILELSDGSYILAGIEIGEHNTSLFLYRSSSDFKRCTYLSKYTSEFQYSYDFSISLISTSNTTFLVEFNDHLLHYTIDGDYLWSLNSSYNFKSFYNTGRNSFYIIKPSDSRSMDLCEFSLKDGSLINKIEKPYSDYSPLFGWYLHNMHEFVYTGEVYEYYILGNIHEDLILMVWTTQSPSVNPTGYIFYGAFNTTSCLLEWSNLHKVNDIDTDENYTDLQYLSFNNSYFIIIQNKIDSLLVLEVNPILRSHSILFRNTHRVVFYNKQRFHFSEKGFFFLETVYPYYAGSMDYLYFSEINWEGDLVDKFPLWEKRPSSNQTSIRYNNLIPANLRISNNGNILVIGSKLENRNYDIWVAKFTREGGMLQEHIFSQITRIEYLPFEIIIFTIEIGICLVVIRGINMFKRDK